MFSGSSLGDNELSQSKGSSRANHCVSGNYLQSYFSEYGFRYNGRGQKQLVFEALLAQILVSAEKRAR